MLYEELRKATPTDLLEAAIRTYTKYADRPGEVECFLRLGFALARPNGWKLIAPAWLQEEYANATGMA